MPEKGGIRAFLAIPSDGLWVESARGLLARLEQALPRASWTKPSSCDSAATMRISGSPTGRPLMWNTRRVATSSSAAAPSPKTVSVGNATTPPPRTSCAARVSPARVGFSIWGPRELTPKALSSWGWRTMLR